MSLPDDILVTALSVVALGWMGWNSVRKNEREEQVRFLREKHIREGVLEGLRMAKNVSNPESSVRIYKVIEREESRLADLLKR